MFYPVPRSRAMLLAVSGLALVMPAARAGAAIKVACLGASTVSGFGSSDGHHFPDELGRALGAGFEVRNFGISGTTILKKGDNPYWNYPQLGQSLAYRPDIAVFWYGGNDTKPQNWVHKDEFVPDYEDMLHMFQALPTHPRLFLFQSIILKDGYGISRQIVDTQILPLTDRIAADTQATVLNDHDTFINHPELFNGDGIHPNDAGNVAIAKHVAGYITRALAAADGGADGSALPDGAGADADAGADAATDGAGPANDSSSPPRLDAPVTGSGTGGAGGAITAGSGGTGGGPATGTGGASGIVSGGNPPATPSSGGCSTAGTPLPLPSALLFGLAIVCRRRPRHWNSRNKPVSSLTTRRK
jgi:acyl-CoA thioesterase I